MHIVVASVIALATYVSICFSHLKLRITVSVEPPPQSRVTLPHEDGFF